MLSGLQGHNLWAESHIGRHLPCVCGEAISAPGCTHSCVEKNVLPLPRWPILSVFSSVFKPVRRLLGMPSVGCCVGLVLARGTVGQAHPAVSYFLLKCSLALRSTVTCEGRVAQSPLDLGYGLRNLWRVMS